MLGFELSTSWSLTWTAEPPLPSIHAVLCPRLTPSLVSALLGPSLILSERKYTLDMRVCLFFGMLVSGFLCMVCLSRSYYSAYFLCLSITASPQSIQLIFPAPLYFILFIIIVSDANSRLYRTDNVAVDHFSSRSDCLSVSLHFCLFSFWTHESQQPEVQPSNKGIQRDYPNGSHMVGVL